MVLYGRAPSLDDDCTPVSGAIITLAVLLNF